MTALAVKATVALAAALFVVLIARKTRASVRHMILAASFAFLLLLPFADRFAPATVTIPAGPVTMACSRETDEAADPAFPARSGRRPPAASGPPR